MAITLEEMIFGMWAKAILAADGGVAAEAAQELIQRSKDLMREQGWKDPQIAHFLGLCADELERGAVGQPGVRLIIELMRLEVPKTC